jgi:hypothetical protein
MAHDDVLVVPRNPLPPSPRVMIRKRSLLTISRRPHKPQTNPSRQLHSSIVIATATPPSLPTHGAVQVYDHLTFPP